MSSRALVFCAYFNTCRANLDGMESWLDRHHESLTNEDKKVILAQMTSDDVLLPKVEDAKERWESIRVVMEGDSHAKTTTSSMGLD